MHSSTFRVSGNHRY